MNHIIKRSLNKNRYEIAMAIAIVIISIISLITAFESDKVINRTLDRYQERNRPANMDIILIKDNSCPYCYDAGELVSEIETENVNIVSQHADRKSVV